MVSRLLQSIYGYRQNTLKLGMFGVLVGTVSRTGEWATKQRTDPDGTDPTSDGSHTDGGIK